MGCRRVSGGGRLRVSGECRRVSGGGRRAGRQTAYIRKERLTILAIDTSCAIFSAALRNEKGVWTAAAAAGNSHAEMLCDAVDSVLTLARCERQDIGLFACMRGPGSFSGLRIGFAFVKGLALALGKPYISVPTLDCIAAPHAGFNGLVIPVLAANGTAGAGAGRPITAADGGGDRGGAADRGGDRSGAAGAGRPIAAADGGGRGEAAAGVAAAGAAGAAAGAGRRFFCRIYRGGEAVSEELDISAAALAGLLPPEEQALLAGPAAQEVRGLLEQCGYGGGRCEAAAGAGRPMTAADGGGRCEAAADGGGRCEAAADGDGGRGEAADCGGRGGAADCGGGRSGAADGGGRSGAADGGGRRRGGIFTAGGGASCAFNGALDLLYVLENRAILTKNIFFEGDNDFSSPLYVRPAV